MSGDDWIAVALLVIVEGTPVVVHDDHVVDRAALYRCVDRHLRKVLDIFVVEIIVGIHLGFASAFVTVHGSSLPCFFLYSSTIRSISTNSSMVRASTSFMDSQSLLKMPLRFATTRWADCW